MGVSENVVYPIVSNGFHDHYPYEQWLFHWEYTQHFQTNPYMHLHKPDQICIVSIGIASLLGLSLLLLLLLLLYLFL